jgi:hypothetical protein
VLAVLLVGLERRSHKADRSLRRAERRAGRGAVGEERVEEILGHLPDDHVVIHDLEASYGNIDHVVLAPYGVFVIETKSQWGRLSTNGSTLLLNGRPLPKDPVEQSLRNALWLRDRIRRHTGLEVFVHALVVFTRACASEPLPKLRGVQILEARHLLEVIAQTHGKEIPADRVLPAIASGPVTEL